MEAGQAQPFWTPAAPEAVDRTAFLPPVHPSLALEDQVLAGQEDRGHPSSALAGQEVQAQPFWAPAAPEAVVRTAFLPPHPRTEVQPEPF